MFAPVVALVFAGLVAAQSTIPGCARDYTVQEGDYCDAISAAKNVSSYQLAVSNYQTINDGCTNLVPGEVICLGETGADCATTYSVQSGDYCDLIASNHGINSTLLMTNNPQIDENCYNLYIGQVLCVANQVLVTPPPAGWTPPGSNLDDGDFTSDDGTTDNSDNSNNSDSNNSGSTGTTTTPAAANTTPAPTTTTTTTKAATTTKASSTDKSSDDNTSTDDADDSEDDGDDCVDY
ncbi:hypothetical protein FRC04_000738 [Tulasnella sp. 424]|nr:hypothetical protein FRC04_000738 [Tulasnella sp. 424]KAG8968571.1 hypothetical protein FRC05_001496 [Tulasnella sp. 425]